MLDEELGDAYDINIISPFFGTAYPLGAKQSLTRSKKPSELKFASWNVRSLHRKEHIVHDFMAENNLDLIAIQEPKKGEVCPGNGSFRGP